MLKWTLGNLLIYLNKNKFGLHCNTLYIYSMINETKNEVINIRVPKAIKKELQELAKQDRRTLSDYIVLHLENIINMVKKAKKD